MLKRIISGVWSDKLLKVTSFTAVSTFVRMLTSLLTNKLIAVLIGTSGFVLIGQLGNIFTIALTFSTAISIGLTKYIAESSESETHTRDIINTGITTIAIYSVVITIGMLLLSEWLASNILKDNKYVSVLIIAAFAFTGSALNGFYLAAINGFKQYKLYVIINIVNSIVTLIYTIALIYYWSVYGALLASATYLSISFFTTYYLSRKIEYLRFKNLRIYISIPLLKKLLLFSIMPITSGIMFPLVQITIRDTIIADLGINSAGYWEGINRISNMVILIITTSLSVYFLPKLSETKDLKDVNKEIVSALKKIIPPLAILTAVIILMRDVIIRVLFTADFIPMNDLFLFQFIGNIFKVAGWIIAYRMLAKAMILDYIVTEVLYYIVYVTLTLLFMKEFGLLGTSLSYALSYFVYFLYLFFRFRIYNYLR